MTRVQSGPGLRLGIDVGGTFTDFVLANPVDGSLVRYKEPSVPGDPSLSIERGLPSLLARANVSPGDVELVVHGTTLPLNALIERRGARLGLVVSRGNRGILEIARATLPNAFSFRLQKEKPLVRRHLIAETDARLDPLGNIVTEAAADDLDRIAELFARNDVDSVVVLLLHSYARPDFEADFAVVLAARFGSHKPIKVVASSSVWPERREFERCTVALMNAFVQPMMDSYFDRLQERLRRIGLDAPVYITSNNGGTLSIDTARERPIDTVLSGPASGVVAASHVAGHAGMKSLVTLDIGGTSADVSVVENGQPAQTTRSRIGSFPLMSPTVDVSAVGAGGGSILWVDDQKVLKVGPQSAGAAPGPVCYGRGGTQPTLTDCYLVSGFFRPDGFLGGRMALDVVAARDALEALADRIGMTGEHRAERVAEAAISIATVMMTGEISRLLAQRGHAPHTFSLCAFGGAGPTHGSFVADDTMLQSVVIPGTPSTFCARGAILADIKRDYVASRHFKLSDGAGVAGELCTIFAELKREASEWIAKEGRLGAPVYEAIADIRYSGQAYDLPIRLDDPSRITTEMLEELFHDMHRRFYTFEDRTAGIEITAQRLRVQASLPPIAPERIATPVTHPVTGRRRIFLSGAYVDATVIQRRDLGPGLRQQGPAIVEQEDATIVVLPNWVCDVDTSGNLVIHREDIRHAADRNH